MPYFIIGMICGLFITLFYETIYQFVECIKSKLNVYIAKNNAIVQDISNSLDKSHTNVIGFSIDSNEDDYESEEMDKSNSMKRIGF